MNQKFDYNIKPIDEKTDFGKGITFKALDGTEWATFEDAQIHNQFLENLIYQKIEKHDDFSYNTGRGRRKN